MCLQLQGSDVGHPDTERTSGSHAHLGNAIGITPCKYRPSGADSLVHNHQTVLMGLDVEQKCGSAWNDQNSALSEKVFH